MSFWICRLQFRLPTFFFDATMAAGMDNDAIESQLYSDKCALPVGTIVRTHEGFQWKIVEETWFGKTFKLAMSYYKDSDHAGPEEDDDDRASECPCPEETEESIYHGGAADMPHLTGMVQLIYYAAEDPEMVTRAEIEELVEKIFESPYAPQLVNDFFIKSDELDFADIAEVFRTFIARISRYGDLAARVDRVRRQWRQK